MDICWKSIIFAAMQRTYLNIPTQLARIAVHDDNLLSAVALSVCIKMLRVHSVLRLGDYMACNLSRLIGCSHRKAQRYIEIARQHTEYYEVGDGYIKAHTLIKRFLEERWSRQTKTHGHLHMLCVDRLRLEIPTEGAISINAVKHSLRELIALDEIRKAYRATHNRNKSVQEIIGIGLGTGKTAEKLYSAGYVGNMTNERIGRAIGLKKSATSRLMEGLVSKGIIEKHASVFDYLGKAEDHALNFSAVVVNGNAFAIIPNAYRFKSKKEMNRTGHLIYNHTRRTGMPQMERIDDEEETRVFTAEPDATNQSVKISAYYRYYESIENDQL